MKTILTRVLCLVLCLLLPAAALAEPLPWLKPWADQYARIGSPDYRIDETNTLHLNADAVLELYDYILEFEVAQVEASLREYLKSVSSEIGEESTEDETPQIIQAFLTRERAALETTRQQAASMVPAVSALLNEVSLRAVGAYPAFSFEVLLSGQPAFHFALQREEGDTMSLTSDLFPGCRVPYPMPASYPEGYAQALSTLLGQLGTELDPQTLQAVEALLARLRGGMPGLVKYNFLTGCLAGTDKDLALLKAKGLATETEGGALRYSGSLSDFMALFESESLPYAPVYTLLKRLRIPALTDGFAQMLSNTAQNALVDVTVERTADEAVWDLAVTTYSIPMVTWNGPDGGDDGIVWTEAASGAQPTFSLDFSEKTELPEDVAITVDLTGDTAEASPLAADQYPPQGADAEAPDFSWTAQDDFSYYAERTTQHYTLRCAADHAELSAEAAPGGSIVASADASAPDEITGSLEAKLNLPGMDAQDALYGSSFSMPSTRFRLTRTEEGQVLSVSSPARFRFYSHGETVIDREIPLEFRMEYRNDFSRSTVTALMGEGENEKALFTYDISIDPAQDLPAAPDPAASVLVEGFDDPRLLKEIKTVAIPALNRLILTRLPQGARPLMTTLLGLVATLGNAIDLSEAE